MQDQNKDLVNITSGKAFKEEYKKAEECINVCLRIRPRIPEEIAMELATYEIKKVEKKGIETNVLRLIGGVKGIAKGSYDNVFDWDNSQQQVYEVIEPKISKVIEGYNCSIFAYGQTGSGKTYTMFGESFCNDDEISDQNQLVIYDKEEGMIPRSIKQVFREINEKYESTMMEFTVYCSFIQIYNEKLYDLFQDPNASAPLQIREDKYAGVFVEGLSEYVITNPEDCLYLMRRGEFNRITRQTKSNQASSRSHSLFQLVIENVNHDNNGKLIRAKLNLCDLAGSEKIHAEEKLTENHMEEHKSINLSLSTLGKVVAALSKNKSIQHIPFRESKLTRLLKDSLGGNTNTILIGTLSPLTIHADESISTMKFADRAMKIQVRAIANEINPEDDKLVQKLRREVMHLREILHMRSDKNQRDINNELLNLKEENNKLREMNGNIEEVERLKQENKRLRLIIQDNTKVMMIKQEEADEKQLDNSLIDNKELGENCEQFGEKEETLENMNKENNQIINNCRSDSFFITETSSEMKQAEAQKKKSIKPPLPNLSDVLNDSKARETILSSNFKYTENSSLKKAKPLMIMDGFDHNLMTYHKEETPTNKTKDFSRLSNRTDIEIKPRVTREMGLREIHTAAQSLKSELVVQNRCRICTLKLPCKHFSSIEEMREGEHPTQNITAICNIAPCAQTVPNFTLIAPLPRTSSQGIQRRCDQGKLTPLQINSHSIERIAATEKDSSFASGCITNNQHAIFRDNMAESHSQQASHTFVNSTKRLEPSDRSTCTIRIRSKNNVEIVKGNVKRTISEIRNNKSENSKLKDAKKRLKMLEKIEQYRKEKMVEELKQLEIQNAIFEEHHKQELKREQKKKQYFDMRKRELAEAQEQKFKEMK